MRPTQCTSFIVIIINFTKLQHVSVLIGLSSGTAQLYKTFVRHYHRLQYVEVFEFSIPVL